MSSAVPEQFCLTNILNAVSLGLIVVDSDEQILLWNEWIAKSSDIPEQQALQKKIAEVFKEAPNPAFLSALRNSLNYGLPAVLSNALHRSPLPLYATADADQEKQRIHQSIAITPLPENQGKRCCLIQISDSSNSIKREKMLRSHSEILKRDATTDSLTGIYNRRFFDEHYKMALGLSIRQKLPLSIFMVDIDFFKEYNDYYGHPEGDKALISVAQTLKAQLARATDVLARYGGEEFILILPNMPQEHAEPFAERLRAAIWDSNIPHLKSKIASQLSISIGVSTYDQIQQNDVKLLIQSADSALYQAKQLGRNRVAFFAPDKINS
ncbi:diguanylate cyclase [Undibacterium sp. Ren11W]|uniref:sensor domain-containing diguanylate cyclase n=1 Tax=Undibacterium sp. Ren11W TaxID=3413045 RepID=UPI003BF0B1CD